MRYTKSWGTMILLAAVLLIGANSAYARIGGSKAGTFYGAARTVGNGWARTWVTNDQNGNPVATGINFSEAALTGLPAGDTEYILPLPKQASSGVFKHVVMDWNPQGHFPPPVYGVPHFDFHFYTISLAERNQISFGGNGEAVATKAPAPANIPQGYITAPGAAMPRMGNHWIPATAPELSGGKSKFTATPIYGFYNGQMAFIEPMATLAFLQTKPNLTQPLAVPQSYATSGYYPTNYSISFHPECGQYTVALGGMVLR